MSNKLLKYIIYLFLYIFISVIILKVNVNAFIMYSTLLPLHLIIYHISLKGKSFFCKFFSFYFLITQGINSVLFYLYYEKYSYSGFSAVGNFDFYKLDYFYYYSFIFVFISVFLFCLDKFYKNGYYSFNYLLSFCPKFKIFKKNLMILFYLIAILLTLIMYYLSIGIRGIPSPHFPYHIVGLLYYTRLIIFTIIIYIYTYKYKYSNLNIFFVILYSFIVGITSSSRGLITLILIPVVFCNILLNQRKKVIMLLVFWFIIFTISSLSRNYTYYTSERSIQNLCYNILIDFQENNLITHFLDFCRGIGDRFFGCQSVVLASQYNKLSFNDLLLYYNGYTISQIVPNIEWEIFHMHFPEGKEYGVALGFIGDMVCLSQNNYFLVFIQAIFCAIIFSFIENNFVKIIQSKNTFVITFCTLIVFFSFYIFIMGTGMSKVYKIAMVLYLIENVKLSRFAYIPSKNALKRSVVDKN